MVKDTVCFVTRQRLLAAQMHAILIDAAFQLAARPAAPGDGRYSYVLTLSDDEECVNVSPGTDDATPPSERDRRDAGLWYLQMARKLQQYEHAVRKCRDAFVRLDNERKGHLTECSCVICETLIATKALLAMDDALAREDER